MLTNISIVSNKKIGQLKEILYIISQGAGSIATVHTASNSFDRIDG
jgi:uncharacterized protein with ACT and thioredoxin-like domain